MTTESDISLWIRRHLDGESTKAETRALRAAIERDPTVLDRLYETAVFETDLSAWLADHARRRPKAHRRLRFGAPLALAASLLAALGIGLWLNRARLEPIPGAAIARVESVQGSVFSVQDAAPERLALKAGDEILPGMRIETGADSAATLAWLDKTAHLTLAESSVLSMPAGVPSVSFQKRMVLHQGALTAAVARQPAAQPFEAKTPHARATVLGTRFRLNVKRTSNIQQGTSNVQGDSTWLSVEEGLVRFARLADEDAIEVAAGRFAVAGATPDDFRLKAYPADTEWIDGRVIFEDDFSEGLKRWLTLQGRVDKATQNLTYEAFVQEDGRHIEAKRGTKGKEQGVLIRNREDSGTVFPIILLNRPVKASAYSVEWEFRQGFERGQTRSRATQHWWGVTDLEVVIHNEKRISAGDAWRKQRNEMIPLDESAKPYRWLQKTFHEGELQSVHRVNLDPEKIGFFVHSGNAFLVRCTIRELIPVTEVPAQGE